MNRVDLYGTVHKGIRALLFETTVLVARSDFALADESSAAGEAVRRMLAFLDEHAEHEDEVILPELARVAPELFAELEREHTRVHGQQAELEALTARLEDATPAQRVSLGRRLHERLARLTVAHLEHMEREEGQANRVLWAHLDDVALAALEQRIVAPIPAPRMAQWLELMLPAMNRSERAEMLEGLRAALSAPAFEELTAPARAALGPRAWEAALPAVGSRAVASAR